VKKLNVLNIRIDGGTQIRKQLNQDKVSEYAEQMKDGEIFPPITVFHDGTDYWLASGFHRYFATKQIGNTSIDCDVRQGTVEDATLFALGDNKHGLNMTAEDYRKSVLIMLQHPTWGMWTNAVIAKHIGVSAMTVGRVKKANEIVEPEEKTYVNKQGKESTIKTKNLGKKVEQKIAKPDASSDKFVDDDEQKRELAHTIEELAEENTLLRDKIAIGQWNASEIEKIDIEETVTNLRERLRITEIENESLRESRDMWQNRCAEAIKALNAKINAEKRKKEK
jgi:hypothetical protein